MAFKLGNFSVDEVLFGTAQDFDGNMLYVLDQLSSASIEISAESTDITDKKGNIITGVYQEGTHRVVPVESCMIEDQLADEIIGTIRKLAKSFKFKAYNEDTGYGLLRHILVKRGFSSGEVMVVLVGASGMFPMKKKFTTELLKKHPEIT